MNPRRLSLLASFTLVCLTGIPVTAFAAEQAILPTEEIQGKITLRRAYKVGEEAAVSLPVGQVAQFDCTENPFWVKDFFAYAATNGDLLLCWLDTDGEVMGSTRTSSRESHGTLQQVADTPCLAIVKWELQDQTLSLRFSLSTDQEKNQQELDLVMNRKVRMSSRNKNRRPYPVQKLSETERLAGFARLWSEVKYNFAFFDRVPELNWDKVLLEYLPQVQQAETPEDYQRTLTRCLALLHDGHTDVGYRRGPGSYTLPFEVLPLDGKPAVVVRTVPATTLASPKRRAQLLQADLKPGEELTHVDGRPVADILQNDLYPYICASSAQARALKACAWLVSGEYGSTAQLRLRGLDGTEREVRLTRGNYSLPRRTDSGAAYRELPGGFAYVNLPGFESREVVKRFEELQPQLRKTKGLVLDIRNNGGGNSSYGDAIIGLLIAQPLKGSPWKTPQHIAAFKAWGRPTQWYEGAGDPVRPRTKDPFLKPVVVLTGPDTFSAAEDFAVVLHASKRATLVGEPTGGSTGQPLFVPLPGGIQARICTKHDTYPDGREFVGPGVIPDVQVQPTAADIAAGRDVVLAKGLEVLREKCGAETQAER